METSIEYAAALAVMKVAERKYGVALAAYRAMRITDAEFLALRAEHEAATKAFDAAFAKESQS